MTLIKYVEALSDEDKLDLAEYFKTNEKKIFNIEGKELTLNSASIKFE